LAKVDHSKRRRILEELIRRLPTLPFGKAESIAIAHIPYRLVDRSLSRELMQIVSDRDYDLSEGAAAILMWAGSRTGLDIVDVLNKARKTGDKRMRTLYDKMLRRMCNFSHLESLQREWETETSEEIRALIQGAIDDVNNVRGSEVSFVPRALWQRRKP
jgi:hypothetical protein